MLEDPPTGLWSLEPKWRRFPSIHDAHVWALAWMKPSIPYFTSREWLAMRSYKHDGFQRINWHRRKPEAYINDRGERRYMDIRAIADALADGIMRQQAPEGVAVYRGFNDPDAMAGFSAALAAGATLVDPAFGSTSLSADKAFAFADETKPGRVFATILVPKRMQAAYLEVVKDDYERNPREAEILLPRGIMYDVRDVRPVDDVLCVLLEVLPG